jgi:methylmalonyl-CoA mutase
MTYKIKNHIRIVTAAANFDGHDAAINVMRRILQASGAEVIHLGHNRGVKDIVDCAIQEDVQAIAITSYQGGHLEFFKYMFDLLKENQAQNIKIFGGGGGVILPNEIEELQNYGITKIYSPDDGRRMGLQGMIDHLLELSDFPTGINNSVKLEAIKSGNKKAIAELISAAENFSDRENEILNEIKKQVENITPPVLGITGTGGAGKSSLVDEIIRRFLADFPHKTLGIISVDPTKRKTGGALLGDRIRMNAVYNERVYMRSLATRQANLSISNYVSDALAILKYAGFDLIILETSGIGQSDTNITAHSNLSLYVMTPEFGAPTQLEKIDMLDYADMIVLNKFDKHGAGDALRDVRKQFQRNHNLWHLEIDQMPVFACIASQYGDKGTNRFYKALMQLLTEKAGISFKSTIKLPEDESNKIHIIPPARVRYLSEISEAVRAYNQWVEEQSHAAMNLYSIKNTLDLVQKNETEEESKFAKKLQKLYKKQNKRLSKENQEKLKNWEKNTLILESDYYIYKVRDKEIKQINYTQSLSGLRIPKIAVPRFKSWGDKLRWALQENVPGEFPFTAGVFPLKRLEESPTRMFAGEGAPERTNKRFHYVSAGMPAKRLSTAFDSPTLYGGNPHIQPDIYGKIGNSGVSIACLDDAKKLYSGFRLTDAATSVSMTINGSAPVMLAYFMNAAIDQECEIYIKENGLEPEITQKIEPYFAERQMQKPRYNGDLPTGNNGLGLMLLGVTGDMFLPEDIYLKIKKQTISTVRGTVQADILKEDQAQNTCIYSTDFALKLMGDVQEYFIENQVRNFYSVSISGYHIAEAGANPVTQLAFTLANGFTYVEYYASRGMKIDDFAPNLSFFFSNGTDAEYAVLGRVARRIWAKAMKFKYKANERSQKLKYHIQTSGRSLHAQEIDFNDIRTTLQALYAIYDNCNSLHTNAYDEAITTPTEESVRRAMAIQLIINNELGLAKNENPLQGSFIIEELTDLVEEAVMLEFDRLTERGGVLGAMETMYQRNKIQEESLHYERLKHNGELQIIGVNTFLSSKGSPTIVPQEVIRAEEWEKQQQIQTVENLHRLHKDKTPKLLAALKQTATEGKNIFENLMETAKFCSIGEITSALFDVGGQYRRNM